MMSNIKDVKSYEQVICLQYHIRILLKYIIIKTVSFVTRIL